MNTKNMYIGLSSLTMNPCSLTKSAYAQARNTWLCTGCCVPKPEVRGVDVYLEEVPTDKPLNFVNGCGLPVIHHSLLEKLPSELIQRDLFLGRVFGPNDEQLLDWTTFRGRRRLILRGSKNAGHRKCTDCGRDVYFAMGSSYLFPAPSHDADLFESDKFGLVLPLELFEQLDLGKWRKLSIDKLPVLDEPKDGLGVLLNA